MDFRLPENRRECLIRYAVWQDRTNDVDTALPIINYIFDRNEFNIEQRFWFCLLYGWSYNAAMTLAAWNEHPDLENIDIQRLDKWVTDNFNKIKVERDVKWNKGKLSKMVECFIKVLDGEKPSEYFNKLCPEGNDPKDNYRRLSEIVINNFYGFGRYTSFFFLQSIKDCCGVNIEADDMQYGYNCQSTTDGLSIALNREDMSSRIYIEDGRKKLKQDITYSKEYIDYLNQETDSILLEIKTRFSDTNIDYFKFETILCSWKKLWRRRDGRYLGYYINRVNNNIDAIEKSFPGVNYKIIRDYFKECVPEIVNASEFVDTSKMQVFLDTGELPELIMYKDLI